MPFKRWLKLKTYKLTRVAHILVTSELIILTLLNVVEYELLESLHIRGMEYNSCIMWHGNRCQRLAALISSRKGGIKSWEVKLQKSERKMFTLLYI